MDELKAYINGLPDEAARVAFAERCDTTIKHLRNVAYGKTCSPELAAFVETASGGAVRRQHLRPDDWGRIWPELIPAKAAPAKRRPRPAPEPADAPQMGGGVYAERQRATREVLERVVLGKVVSDKPPRGRGRC